MLWGRDWGAAPQTQSPRGPKPMKPTSSQFGVLRWPQRGRRCGGIRSLTLPRQPPSVPAPAPPLRARWHTGQAVGGARQLLGRSGVWWGRWDAAPPPLRHGYLDPGLRPPHRVTVGRRVNRSRHGMLALPDRLHRGPFLRAGPWVIPEAEFLRPGRHRASRGSASSRQELGGCIQLELLT
jgi:hypothetical protein